MDAADLNVVALHWQMPVEGWERGDFTKDGFVNDADRTEVAVHWQQDIPRLVAAAGPVGINQRLPKSPLPSPSYAMESNALQVGVHLPRSAASQSKHDVTRWSWRSSNRVALPIQGHLPRLHEMPSPRSRIQWTKMAAVKVTKTQADGAWYDRVDTAISDWPTVPK